MSENIALKVNNLNVYYKDFHALWDISMEVKEKEIVSIIGANGSGKSTLLNSIAGVLDTVDGTIDLFGENINRLAPNHTVPRGLALVPEGRRVFARMSVYDNLVMGSYTPKMRKRRKQNMDMVFDVFPKLSDRRAQMSNTLSGGEQQMLAIGRALMSEPRLLLCDEISLGLAPVIIKDIYSKLEAINREGVTIVLVEQDVKRSLKVADMAYVMLEGKIILQGKPSSLTEEQVKKAYFGV